MAKKRRNNGELPSPKNNKQYNELVKKGDRFYANRQYTEALACYNQALKYEKYSPGLLINMARTLFALGMKGKAIRMLEHALHQNSSNPAICDTLGHAALSMGMHDLAIKFFRLYIQLNPDDPIGYNNLATALREDDQIDESIDLLQSIVPLFPENHILWNTVGAAVAFRDGYPAAQPFYEEAYRLKPDETMIINNLIMVYTYKAEYDKAREFAKKLLDISPNNPKAHEAYAHICLRSGDFSDAKPSLAWHNHSTISGSIHLPYDIAYWQGQDLTGKTILVSAEQGIGDEILFAALYPDLIKEAEKVIIGCDKRLVPLYQNSFPQAEVMGYQAAIDQEGRLLRMYPEIVQEEIDYMCLFTNVMQHRWTAANQIPDMTNGFLKPDPEKVAYWKEKLDALPGKINIGICWRSGLKLAKRNMYYWQLWDMIPLLKNENVNFINIQYGECDEEFKILKEKSGLDIIHFDELDLRDDFDNSCAMMKNLDLVIGAGTSPTTQAAAVGTPAWWVIYNAIPWWSFGKDKGTLIFPENQIHVKPFDMDWPSFFQAFNDEKFAPFLKTI